MHSSVSVGKRGAVHFLLGAVVFAATAFSTNAAFNARLQGQSRGNTAWLDGNLQGWRDLDAIPCRVYFTGGPANNKVITVEFDHTQGRNPARRELSRIGELNKGSELPATSWRGRLRRRLSAEGGSGKDFGTAMNCRKSRSSLLP